MANNETSGLKVYKRDLYGMNSIQILYVDKDSKKFYGIENASNGAHTTWGLCPNFYETGKKLPHGFLKAYGFKPMYISDKFEMFFEPERAKGNNTIQR